MSKLTRELFGGKDTSQQEEQLKQNELARSYVATQADTARRDIGQLYQPMMESVRSGTQGALDVYGKSVPQQLGAIQQGNMSAQGMLLGGLPLIQDAILGRKVDLSSLTKNFQPSQVNYDASFAQQRLPAAANYTPYQPGVNPFVSPQYNQYASQYNPLTGWNQ